MRRHVVASGWTFALTLLAAAGCGTVHENPDAAPTPDAATAPDAPMLDAAPTIPSAVDVTDITTFGAPSGVFTKVPYAGVRFDDGGEYSVADSRFVPAVAGDYEVCASLFSGSANDRFELDVFIDNVRERGFALGSGAASGCDVVQLAAGSQLDVRVWHNAASTITFGPNSLWNWLTIQTQPSTAGAEVSATFDGPSGGFVSIPFGAERYDLHDELDPAIGRFTASHAGDYQFCAALAGGTTDYELDLFVNGGREDGLGAGHDVVTGCRTIRMAASDYVEVGYYQSSGATRTVNVDPTWDWLRVQPQPTTVSVDGATPFDVPDQTFTKVPYAGELLDDAGQFDNGTFTAATDGDYQFCAGVNVFSQTGIELDLFVDDARLVAFAHGMSGGTGCRTVRLVAGATVDARVRQASGSTISVVSDSFWLWFEVSKLR